MKDKHIREIIIAIAGVDGDLSDIGNEIGLIVGKIIKKENLDEKDFLHGIKHGLDLAKNNQR